MPFGHLFSTHAHTSGELIVSRYVAESITMIAGHFGHEGLCQLRTKLFCAQLSKAFMIPVRQFLTNIGTAVLSVHPYWCAVRVWCIVR